VSSLIGLYQTLQPNLELKTWLRLGIVTGNGEYKTGFVSFGPMGMESLLVIVHSLPTEANAVPELVALAERTAEYDEADQMALLKQVLGCVGGGGAGERIAGSTLLERSLWALLDARIEAAFVPARQKGHATGSLQGGATTTSLNPAPQEPFLPTPAMERVLDALNGRSLTGDALANRLHMDRSGLLRRLVRPLMKAGMIKNNRNAGGYYRPDALDPKLAKKLGVQHCPPPRAATEVPTEAPTEAPTVGPAPT
jgi:hypothetical protein